MLLLSALVLNGASLLAYLALNPSLKSAAMHVALQGFSGCRFRARMQRVYFDFADAIACDKRLAAVIPCL